MKNTSWPILGCGVGLRSPHYNLITSQKPPMDFFEAISENYMDTGGRPLKILEEVRKNYPVVLHGVSLSIGSVDPINTKYLEKLKILADRIEPELISDHLCWTGVEGENLHDLLPLPFTEEAIDFITGRVQKVQDFLKRKILIENVSTYVTYRHSIMPEWEFLREVARRAGCGILLDINNIFVNATNHKFNPYHYVENIPKESVGQFHLAGHTNMGKYLFDTHSAFVADPVWKLYERALELYGPVSTLIEWDEKIPEFEVLANEAQKARVIYNRKNRCQSLKFETVSERTCFKFQGLTPTLPTLAEIEHLVKSEIQPFPHEPSGRLKDLLNPQGGTPGIERLSVYAGGYLTRMNEALMEVYEAITHLLGKDAFFDLVEEYVREYPSHDYSLNFVGKYFADFLKKAALTEQFPFLPDLAGLEWSVSEAFHAFEKSSLKPSEFSAIRPDDWERIQFIFQPSVHVIDSKWPVLDIWRARKSPLKEINIQLIDRPQKVLIYRKELEVYAELLAPDQYEMLKNLLQGKTLGEALEKISSEFGEDLPLTQWFSLWMQNGVIVHCQVSQPT